LAVPRIVCVIIIHSPLAPFRYSRAWPFSCAASSSWRPPSGSSPFAPCAAAGTSSAHAAPPLCPSPDLSPMAPVDPRRRLSAGIQTSLILKRCYISSNIRK